MSMVDGEKHESMILEEIRCMCMQQTLTYKSWREVVLINIFTRPYELVFVTRVTRPEAQIWGIPIIA
jgi:hypothetical protein